LILLALWIFLGLPWLLYPSERIEYRDAPQYSAQDSQTQPNGSPQSPYFVEVIRAPKSVQERKEEAEDREEKKSSDRWLVRWTFALFAATIGLILATSVLGYFGWRQSRDMRESITAAERSVEVAERALTDLEAPFVVIKINAPGLVVQGNTVAFGLLKWCVVNHGRTAATIIEIFDHVGAVDLGGGHPPPINVDKVTTSIMPYGVVAPPSGSSEDFPYLAIVDILDGKPPLGILKSTSKAAFFQGFVRYEDIFKTRFILGFCFIFDNSGNRWILSGGDQFNYCRKESGPSRVGATWRT
jgi:hypothetical protein